VIYQKLEDLQEACAELSPRPNQKFEVGVFCGKYITPVKEEYFQHLDKLRGNRKKEKELQLARQAVAQGVADGDAMQVALGAAVHSHTDRDGQEEVERLAKLMNSSTINGEGSGPDANANDEAKEQGERPSPRWAQDISLHNLNDEAVL
jgi:amidophosphoribosyltransferase